MLVQKPIQKNLKVLDQKSHIILNANSYLRIIFSIIFEASVGHTVGTYSLWDYAANPTIAPWKLDRPLGRGKPVVPNKAEYETYLPKRNEFIEQIKGLYSLKLDDTEDLVDFTHLWVDPVVVDIVNEFKNDIAGLEKEVKKDHRKYPIPYDYILPSAVKSRIDV